MSTHAQRQAGIGDAFLVVTGVPIGVVAIAAPNQTIWHSLLFVWLAVAIMRLWPSARHVDQLSMNDRVTRLVLLAALVLLLVVLLMDTPLRIAPMIATELAAIFIVVDVLRYG